MATMDEHAAQAADPLIAELRERRFEPWPEEKWSRFVVTRSLLQAGVYESVGSEADKQVFAAKVAEIVRAARPPDAAD